MAHFPQRQRVTAPEGARRRRVLALASGTTAVLLAATACGSGSSGGSDSADGKIGVSLILKTLSNPFFVSMEKSAKAQSAKSGVKLSVTAASADGDTQSQINAIDSAIARGDKGILITPNGDAVNKELAKARKAGIYVIALDTAPSQKDAADITYATDNLAAGKLIGGYTAARLGGKKAVVAMLDAFDDQVLSVDVQRDHGFLQGMGIDPGGETLNGKEAKKGRYTAGKGGDYVIACHQATQSSVSGGRTAMEKCLSANPSINVVYSINEQAGQGAYQALKAAGKQNSVLSVTIDGSCAGVENVGKGVYAADALQFPGKMGGLGVEAIAKLAKGGKKPTTSDGLSFFNTGTSLVAAEKANGVDSQTVEEGLKECWG